MFLHKIAFSYFLYNKYILTYIVYKCNVLLIFELNKLFLFSYCKLDHLIEVSKIIHNILILNDYAVFGYFKIILIIKHRFI